MKIEKKTQIQEPLTNLSMVDAQDSQAEELKERKRNNFWPCENGRLDEMLHENQECENSENYTTVVVYEIKIIN